MNSKAEIAAKIASLKAYSISKNAKTGPLFAPLETAVETYYSGDKTAISAACETTHTLRSMLNAPHANIIFLMSRLIPQGTSALQKTPKGSGATAPLP